MEGPVPDLREAQGGRVQLRGGGRQTHGRDHGSFVSGKEDGGPICLNRGQMIKSIFFLTSFVNETLWMNFF